MRWRAFASVDPITLVLLVAGAVLVAASLVGVAVLLTPAAPPEAAPDVPPTPVSVSERPAVALPAGRVASVLYVDPAAGAGVAARAGDHVDVLGYFSRQMTGTQSTTRLLLGDVEVLTVDHSGPNVALTLAVPQADVLLLQEAQALGAKPFVALRSTSSSDGAAEPGIFSDADLANRLASPAPSAGTGDRAR
jgi:Flp pilus assembly protein RcpC/CpaB